MPASPDRGALRTPTWCASDPVTAIWTLVSRMGFRAPGSASIRAAGGIRCAASSFGPPPGPAPSRPAPWNAALHGPPRAWTRWRAAPSDTAEAPAGASVGVAVSRVLACFCSSPILATWRVPCAMCMVPLWSADRSERIQYISSEVSSSADSPRIRCMSSDERFPLFSQQWGAGVTSDAVPPRPGMDRSTESVQSCRMSGAVRSCHLAPFLAGHFREQGRAPPRARCHCAAHCRTRSQVCPCPSGALGGASLGPIAPCAGT